MNEGVGAGGAPGKPLELSEREERLPSAARDRRRHGRRPSTLGGPEALGGHARLGSPGGALEGELAPLLFSKTPEDVEERRNNSRL